MPSLSWQLKLHKEATLTNGIEEGFNDACLRMFRAAGAGTGNFNDLFVWWARNVKGLSGVQFNDLMYQYWTDSAVSSLTLSLPAPDATGKYDLAGWYDTRDDDLLELDHAGVWRTIPGVLNAYVPGGVVPLAGARIEQNIQNPALDSNSWVAGWIQAATVSWAAGEVEVVGNADQWYSVHAVTAGTEYTVSCIMQDYADSGLYAIYDATNASWIVPATAYGTAFTARNRFAVTFITPASCTSIRFYPLRANGGAGSLYYFNNLQIELGNKPGEYQQVDHANGFYGFAYYATENGNTVSGNAVTEAVGALISPAPEMSHWYRSTNIYLNSRTPVDQTLTLSVGSWTIRTEGTVTAVITANTAVGTGWGTASDGSDITLDITTAGTIDLVIANPAGSSIQVENLPYASPHIKTLGVPVSREDVQIQHLRAGYFNPTEGVVVCDVDIGLSLAEATQENYAHGIFGTRSVTSWSVLLLHTVVGKAISRTQDGYPFVGITWSASNKYRICVRYKAGSIELGYQDLIAGTPFVWGADSPFSGFYIDGSDVYIGKASKLPLRFSKVDVYDTDMTTAEIEALP